MQLLYIIKATADLTDCMHSIIIITACILAKSL